MADNWLIKQSVDLNRGLIQPQVWAQPLMVSGDNKAHEWRITVLRDGVPALLSGYSVMGYFGRADGNYVVVTGTHSANVATITMPDQCYAVSGPLVGIIRLTKSGEVIMLSRLGFKVAGGVNGGLVDPGDTIPSIDELLALLAEMEDALTAEQGRVSAESGRVTAEATRVSQENTRKTAEQGRVTAENGRVSAENARVSAENARATAETSRSNAEASRVTAENTRVSQENARKTAEQGRVTAESGRVTAETNRVAAETARASAESSRVSAESSRVAAESGRVTAENSRVQAEAARQTASSTAVTNANNAATNANAAATKINGLTVDASTISPDTDAYTNLSTINGAYHIDFMIPQGMKGNPGDPFTIADQVNTPENLPSPATTAKNLAYRVLSGSGGAPWPDGNAHIFMVKGSPPGWIDLGPLAGDSGSILITDGNSKYQPTFTVVNGFLAMTLTQVA